MRHLPPGTPPRSPGPGRFSCTVRSSLRWVLLLTLCPSLFAAAAFGQCEGATHENYYRDALVKRRDALDLKKRNPQLRSLEALRWERVVAALEAALKACPREGGRPVATSAHRSEPYLPHLLLGEALFELGRYSEAVRHLTLSERTGAMAVSLETGRYARMLQVARALVPSQKAIREAEEAKETLEALIKARRSGDGTVAALEADQKLRAARRKLRLAAVNLDAEKIPDLLDEAREARDGFSELRATFLEEDARAAEQAALLAELQAEVEALERKLKTALEESADWSDSQVFEEARKLFEAELVPEEGETRSTKLAERKAELETDLGALEKLRSQFPPSLALALGAYQKLHYEETLRILEAKLFRAPRNQQWRCLLRAAAYHAEFRLGGEQDTVLVDRARQAARECRNLGETFEAPADLFSPSFREFYRDATSSGSRGPESASSKDRPKAPDLGGTEERLGPLDSLRSRMPVSRVCGWERHLLLRPVAFQSLARGARPRLGEVLGSLGQPEQLRPSPLRGLEPGPGQLRGYPLVVEGRRLHSADDGEEDRSMTDRSTRRAREAR